MSVRTAWTPERIDRARELRRQGWRWVEVAADLGATPQAMRTAAKKHGLAGTLPGRGVPVGVQWTSALFGELEARHAAGESWRALAAELGVTDSALWQARRRHGRPMRRPLPARLRPRPRPPVVVSGCLCDEGEVCACGWA